MTTGGDKVPHDNGLNSRKGQRATRVWPKVSGILWQVVDPSRDPRIRTNGAFRTRNCEHIRHFCAHGETEDGRCLSPTGKPVASARHSA